MSLSVGKMAEYLGLKSN